MIISSESDKERFGNVLGKNLQSDTFLFLHVIIYEKSSEKNRGRWWCAR